MEIACSGETRPRADRWILSQEWEMAAVSDDRIDLPGIGPAYLRKLSRAGISTIRSLQERCATAEDRKLLSWQSGVPQALLERWYRASFRQSGDKAAPADEGVTTRETEFISGPGGGNPFPSRPGLAAGPRLIRKLGEHRVFAAGTLGVAGVLLLGGFAIYLRGLSRPSDRPAAVPLDSRGAVDVSSHPPSPATLEENSEGERLFRLGEFESARQHFEKATTLDAKSGEAWLNLGRTLARLKNLEGAEAALRRAAELDPRSVAPPYYLGHVAMARGDFSKAAALCRDAIRLDPTFRYAWFDLGILSHRAASEVVLEPQEREPVMHSLVSELSNSEPAEASEAMATLESLSGANPPPRDPAGWRSWWEERTRSRKVNGE